VKRSGMSRLEAQGCGEGLSFGKRIDLNSLLFEGDHDVC